MDLGHRRAHPFGSAGDLVGQITDAAVAEHVRKVVLDAREGELDRVADRELVDAHDGVRDRPLIDVVVVGLVLEAVETEVLEPVGGAAHVERGAEVVERDVGGDRALEGVLDDLVGQDADSTTSWTAPASTGMQCSVIIGIGRRS